MQQQKTSLTQFANQVITCLAKNEPSQLKRVLDADSRLSESLTYFKDLTGKPTQPNYDAITNLAQKWSFGGDITTEMKNQILVPLSDQLNLECSRVVELADWYFQQHKQGYEYIISCEKKMNEIQLKGQQQIQGQHNQITLEQQRSQLELWNQALKQACRDAIVQIRSLYFTERRQMVFVTYKLLEHLHGDDIHKVATDYFKQSAIIQNLIKSLVRNCNWINEFANLPSEEKGDKIATKVFSEQILMLQTLLQLWYSGESKKQDQDSFFEYLTLTNFKGEMSEKQFFNLSPDQLQKRAQIKMLSQVCALAMMFFKSKLNLDPKYIIDPNQLTPASGFVYFAVATLIKQQNKYAEKFDQLSLTAEFQEIMSSELIFTNQKSIIIDVLGVWLEMLFEYESSKSKLKIDQQKILEIQVINLDLLRDEISVKNVWQNGIEKQRIFKETLDNPFKNFDQFITILERLCGKSRSPYSQEVMKFLVQKKLLAELFGWIALGISKLEQQLLDEAELVGLNNCLIVLAKIIKSDPQQYLILSQEYIKVYHAYQNQELKLQCDLGSARAASKSSLSQLENQSVHQLRGNYLQFEGGDSPIVNLMIKALRGLIQVDINYAEKPISKIFDSLAITFKNFQDQRSAIIQTFMHQQGQDYQFQMLPPLISFLQQTMYTSNISILSSFINFLRTAFKVQHPFECVQVQLRALNDKNFLSIALQQVYQPLLGLSHQFENLDVKSRVKLTCSLLRLTLVLLQKFLQVDDNGQKILLKQPTPYFDPMLDVLFQVLDQHEIYQGALDCLNIVQYQQVGQLVGYQNKIIINASKQSSRLLRKNPNFQTMTITGIQVLNTLLQLGLSTPIKERDSISKQSFYIRNLSPVQEIVSRIKDLTNLRMEDQTLITIPALIAYYVKPQNNLLNNPEIAVQAFKFLTLTCRVVNQVNLQNTLKQVYKNYLHDQMMSKFLQELNQDFCINQSIAFVDFWIQAVKSQKQLVEELWNAKDADFLEKCLKTQFDQRLTLKSSELKQKICVLVSEMSVHRCCLSTVEFSQHFLLHKIFDFVIKPILDQLQDNQLKLNGTMLYNLNDQQIINATIVEISAGFNAKIVLYYYMKLIQFEFQRVPAQKTIRLIITKLWCNNIFQQIAIEQNAQETYSDLVQQVEDINDNILHGPNSMRNHQMQNILQQQIQATTKQSEAIQLGLQSFLFSKEGSVCLSSLDCKDQKESLNQKPLYSYFNTHTNETESKSCFGSQFIIDVCDFDQTLYQECYENPQINQQICCFFLEFNLALSQVTVNEYLLKAKAEFITSIGQTQMQILRGKVPLDLHISASILPLVLHDDFVPKSKAEMVQYKQQLIIQQTNAIKRLHSSSNRVRSQLSNKIFSSHLEAQLQLLQTSLGVLAHFITTHDKDQNDSKDIPNIMVNILHTLPECSLFKSEDEQTCVLFSQIAMLSSQIIASFQQRIKSTSIMQSLQKVLQSMQQGYCFTEGIQILGLMFDILDQEAISGLMNRQSQVGPLNILVYRIQDYKTTFDQMQQILTLLQNYAQSVEGSENLHRAQIVEHLQNSHCLKLLNIENPYETVNQVQRKHSVHQIWLQTLVLVRQINANLIQQPRQSDSNYFKSCCKFVKNQQQRFQDVMGVSLQQVAPSAIGKGSVVSIAILEEVELITSVLSQLFAHADLWEEIDKYTYSNMKDCMLFIVPRLFTHCVSIRSVQASSCTEQHLQSKTSQNLDKNYSSILGSQSERTGLQLKMEMSLVSMMLSCTVSLNNIICLQRENSNKNQLVQTWNRVESNNLPSIERLFLCEQVHQPFLQFAFENYLESLQALRELYLSLRSSEANVKKLLEYVVRLFQNDQWTLSEYQGSLSSILIPQDLQEIMDQIEMTLGMGMHVLCGLLEHVNNVITGFGDQSIGFTGGQTPFQGNYQSFYDKEGYQQHVYLDEKSLVFMAKSLANQIRQINDTVKTESPPWVNSDKYFIPLLEFTQQLTKNPIGSHSFY